MTGPHGADWHAQAFGEFGLAEASLGADRFLVRPRRDTALGDYRDITPNSPQSTAHRLAAPTRVGPILLCLRGLGRMVRAAGKFRGSAAPRGGTWSGAGRYRDSRV